MKILTGDQIKELDNYTIQNEPVSSLELMERASEVIAQAICEEAGEGSSFLFFIGKGNNGGDGLAVARMLSNAGLECSVCMLYDGTELSEECAINYGRLPQRVEKVKLEDITADDENCIVIDAILGSGVRGRVNEKVLSYIEFINSLQCKKISIDLPSGMQTEFDNDPQKIVKADITLTIEFPKLAMLLPEAGENCGTIKILSAELSSEYQEQADTTYFFVDDKHASSLLLSRPKFSHKGTFGHTLLICGSSTMGGAAILSALGALRSGCGLVTVHIPQKIATPIYSNAPSAILSLDPADVFTSVPEDIEKYNSVGIGCGLGQQPDSAKALAKLLELYRNPMIIDADALNIISANQALMQKVPNGSILTPHPGELKRMIGEWKDDRDKINKIKELCMNFGVILVLKGAYSLICCPQGNVYINSTGGAGMAKGGSGDILTGLLAGLVARGYDSLSAATLGVYLHGRAGDKCAEYYGAEAMNSSDIVDFIAEAYSEIN